MGFFSNKGDKKKSAPSKNAGNISKKKKKVNANFEESVVTEALDDVKNNKEFALSDTDFLVVMLPLTDIGDPKNRNDEMYGNFVNQANSGAIQCFVNKQFVNAGFILVLPTKKSFQAMLDLEFPEDMELQLIHLIIDPADPNNLDVQTENTFPIILSDALAVANEDMMLTEATDGAFMSVADKSLEDTSAYKDAMADSDDDAEGEYVDGDDDEFDDDSDTGFKEPDEPDEDDYDDEDDGEGTFDDTPDDIPIGADESDDDYVPNSNDDFSVNNDFIDDDNASADNGPVEAVDDTTPDTVLGEDVADSIVLNDDLGLVIDESVFNKAVANQIRVPHFKCDYPLAEQVGLRDGQQVAVYNEISMELNDIGVRANAAMKRIYDQKVAELRKNFMHYINVSVGDLEKDFSDDPDLNSDFYRLVQELEAKEQEERQAADEKIEEKRAKLQARFDKEIQAARDEGAAAYEIQYHNAHDTLNNEALEKIDHRVELAIESKYRNAKSVLYADRRERAGQMFAERIAYILEVMQGEFLSVNDAVDRVYEDYQVSAQKCIDTGRNEYNDNVSKIKASLELKKDLDEMRKSYTDAQKSFEAEKEALKAKQERLVEDMKEGWQGKYDELERAKNAALDREKELNNTISDMRMKADDKEKEFSSKQADSERSFTARIKHLFAIGIILIVAVTLAGIGIGYAMGSSHANQTAIEVLTQRDND